MFNLEEIYSNCRNANSVMERIVFQMRRQNYDLGLREYKLFLSYYQVVAFGTLGNLQEMQALGIEIEPTIVSSILNGLMKAQENKDYILLADLMELQAAPFLSALMEAIAGLDIFCYGKCYFEQSIEALQINNPELMAYVQEYSKRIKCLKTNTLVSETEYLPGICSRMDTVIFESSEGGRYIVEPTVMGLPTLRVEKAGTCLYLHSNKSPVWEAEQLANEYYDPGEKSYHLLGLGLGYTVFALYQRTRGLCELTVYENDVYVIILAMIYCSNISKLFNTVKIVYDPDLTMIARGSQVAGSKLVIHHPSLQLLPKSIMTENLKEYFVQESSYRNQKELLESNFQYNLNYMKNNPHQVMDADSLIESFYGKTVYIIAAGPSLDKNIEELKNRDAKSIILTTGTAFFKLLHLKITPDYVIETDANERTLFHIRCYEDSKIPMLLLSTANCHFMERYKGDKYLVFQRDFEKSESYRNINGGHLYQTGGSVATVALDIMIYYKAKKIVFLGLDLAFTDNLAHAALTSGKLATDKEELIRVPGYFGDWVYADSKFIIYRKWIEHRLLEEDVRGIQIINATEGGSYIKGMEHKKLTQVL